MSSQAQSISPVNSSVTTTLKDASPNLEDKTASNSVNVVPNNLGATAGGGVNAKFQKDNITNANVLNGYRAVTYNFTLAALNAALINDPKVFESNDWEKYIVLTSKGKGQDYAINPGSGASSTAVAANAELSSDPFLTKRTTIQQIKASQKNIDYLNSVPGIVDGFNKNSPGRFDMYIDNVELENAIAYTKKTNASLTTSIKFDVYEPYSINGFTEALHVAAIAAGYTSYVGASFILKMEFIGYPHDVDLPNPEPIKDATRYFVFGFTGFEVTLTENGTKYNCTGVPFSELPLGKSTTLSQSVTARGSTVEEILVDLMAKLTNRSRIDIEKINPNEPYDQFAIKFKVYNDNGDYKDAASSVAGPSPVGLPQSKIAQATISKSDGKGNANPGMAPPADTTSTSTGYQQSSATVPVGGNIPTISYRDNTTLVDAISNTIRDSSYLQDKLKDIKNNIDSKGWVDYFLVSTEVENLGYSSKLNREMYRYTFVVSNHKLHYTLIPGFGNEVVDQKELDSTCLRNYNYIYTGNNIDILGFKLNFNTLFYEAIPARLGSGDFVNRSRTQSVADNSITPNQGLARGTQASPAVTVASNLPRPKMMVNPDGTAVVPNSGGGAGNEYDDYFALARNMHEAIVNSKSSMLTGELNILGDPFYLISGGVGSYAPAVIKPGLTATGESRPMYSQLNIRINFKNVYDINTLEKGGTIQDSKNADFSGVYRVNTLVSSFRSGVFTQRLSIMRVPGQITNEPNAKVTVPASSLVNNDASLSLTYSNTQSA